jgi:hypothetical protein
VWLARHLQESVKGGDFSFKKSGFKGVVSRDEYFLRFINKKLIIV